MAPGPAGRRTSAAATSPRTIPAETPVRSRLRRATATIRAFRSRPYASSPAAYRVSSQPVPNDTSSTRGPSRRGSACSNDRRQTSTSLTASHTPAPCPQRCPIDASQLSRSLAGLGVCPMRLGGRPPAPKRCPLHRRAAVDHRRPLDGPVRQTPTPRPLDPPGHQPGRRTPRPSAWGRPPTRPRGAR